MDKNRDKENFRSVSESTELLGLSTIQILYLVVMIVWIFLILLLHLYDTGFVGMCLAIIPIIFFGISGHHDYVHTTKMLDLIFTADFLSFIVLVTMLAMNWQKHMRDKRILSIICIAIFFMVVSVMDVVTSPLLQIYVASMKNAFEIVALALILFASYIFYLEVDKVDENSFDQSSKEVATFPGVIAAV